MSPKTNALGRAGAFAPLLIFVLLFAGLSILVPDFFGIRNMRGLILSVTLVGTVATTMMLVLALREVDLSVGSITALSGVVCAVTISSSGSVALGVVAGLAAGLLVGLANGAIVAKLNTDLAQRTSQSFQVRGIPTSIVFVNGKEAVRQTGAVPYQALASLIDKAGAA